MRRLYMGDTAVGKTEMCLHLIENYKEQGLEVVTNIPQYNTHMRYLIDDKKRKAMLQQSEFCLKLYTNQPIKNINNLERREIQSLFDYLTYEGDVLILDDVDSNQSDRVIFELLDLLREWIPTEDNDITDETSGQDDELWGMWKHVILTGYSRQLISFTMSGDNNREEDRVVHFINEDGTVDAIGFYMLDKNGEDVYSRHAKIQKL